MKPNQWLCSWCQPKPSVHRDMLRFQTMQNPRFSGIFEFVGRAARHECKKWFRETIQPADQKIVRFESVKLPMEAIEVGCYRFHGKHCDRTWVYKCCAAQSLWAANFCCHPWRQGWSSICRHWLSLSALRLWNSTLESWFVICHAPYRHDVTEGHLRAQSVDHSMRPVPFDSCQVCSGTRRASRKSQKSRFGSHSPRPAEILVIAMCFPWSCHCSPSLVWHHATQVRKGMEIVACSCSQRKNIKNEHQDGVDHDKTCQFVDPPIGLLFNESLHLHVWVRSYFHSCQSSYQARGFTSWTPSA